jgi:phosphoribosyl 1,2-cyclic phosphodiesterase
VPDELLEIGDIRILPVSIYHDASQPVAFLALANGVRSAFVTDLGLLNTALLQVIADVEFLLIEANHDADALQLGPYPPYLRLRVARNHLNNDQLAAFLLDHFVASKQQKLAVGHISRNNNDWRLVQAIARQALGKANKSVGVQQPAGGQAALGCP